MMKLTSIKLFIETGEREQGMMRDDSLDGYMDIFFLTVVKPRDAAGGKTGGR